MTVIPNSRELRIRNTAQLPHGMGCRFLEVMTSHIEGEYIAVQWRRKAPTTLPPGRLLVEFTA